MADEMQQIQSKPLRGYDVTNNDGLWVEWSDSDGAWYVRVTLYEGGVSESNVVARQTFALTNENDGFEEHSYVFTEAVSGHTYIVGIKYLPEANSEAWSESDESYSSSLTYTGPNNPPPPNPFSSTIFKIRDYDDNSVQVDYIGHDWTTFVTDATSLNASGLQIFIKKSTDSEYTEINALFSYNNTTSGTDGDYNWESGVYNSGFYNGWGWLNFTNLEPLTTYTVYAYAVKNSDCYPVIEGEEITWTTTAAPVAPTQLPTPTNFASDARTTTSVSLTWDAVTNAASYEAVCTLNGVDTTLTPSSNSCEFTGLSAGTTYSFKVKAVAASGSNYLDSDYTTPISVLTQTQLARPSINGYPRAGVGTGMRYSSIQLRLAATIANATTYEYQIATNSSFTEGLLTKTSATVSSGYPVSGYFENLTEGQLYYCRARAKSSNSDYATSPWSSATSTTVTARLAVPTGLGVENITESSSTLNWGAVSNASGYTVKWRKEGSSTWTSQDVN